MDIQLSNNQSDFLFYTSSEGKTKIQVILNDETVWLTQKSIAELFGVQRPAITKHLKNIFDSEELNENSVSSILEHTANDNKTHKTKFYNLNAIISVGYRVNSNQAKRQIIMKMKDWIEKLDAFLQFNQYDVLKNAGKVSAKVAKELAETEYNKFRIKQDENFLSDFDNQMERIKK